MCKVINKFKSKPEQGQEYVYIGRPSKWGNPYVIGQHGTRAEVIARFKEEVLAHPNMITAIKRELRGKNLVCYCAPQACHGDILLEIANS